MFEAIIFDLDGLLVDSEKCHLEAWNQALKPYDVQLEDFEAAALTDRRDFENAELFFRRYNLDTDPISLFQQRNEIFMEMAEDRIEAMPGAAELVQSLRDNNFRLALVSAGLRDYIYMITEKLGMEEAFDVILAGDMVEIWKPNPMPFLACAETFALHPTACLVVEDSRLGIEAARNANMKTICIPGPYTERWRITGADVVLNSLDYVNLPTIRSLWTDTDDRSQLQPQPQLQPDPRYRPYRRW
ncbi:MAG TPA: HAD family phosphatase [Chloroflexia bacterium]|nr:HAD family phosphatase [Chloroflexia bacterium]